jgi:hypothetical protein
MRWFHRPVEDQALVRLLAASAAGFASFLSLPVTASAQIGPGAPVTINSCQPMLNTFMQPSPAPSFDGMPLATTSSGIAIQFVNDANKTADLVNFAVNSNGQQFVIRDVGTFSPGVSISHTYRTGAGQSFVLPQLIAPNIRCHVASVRFADGSVWRPGQTTSAPPEPAPPSSPLTSSALSVYPARLVLDQIAESELFLVTSTSRVAAFKETDDCAGIATVFVSSTGESSSAYTVRPTAPGSCTARITDEAGNALSYPIVVR